MAVGLSGTAVVASFASVALGWRLETAFRVVAVEQRVRQAVGLACLVVGKPSGATVARIREDRHTVVVVGGWRARRVSAVGLLLGGPVGLRPARLDALREQDADLAQQLGPQATTSPDAAELAAVADNLETTIATADPRQAKALLRPLIKDLRVNGRSEILATYRVVTPAVCALPSSVGRTGIEPVTLGLKVPCSTN
jgi:hypothetical protein